MKKYRIRKNSPLNLLLIGAGSVGIGVAYGMLIIGAGVTING